MIHCCCGEPALWKVKDCTPTKCASSVIKYKKIKICGLVKPNMKTQGLNSPFALALGNNVEKSFLG